MVSEERGSWDARYRVMEQHCPRRLTRNTPWMRRVGFSHQQLHLGCSSAVLGFDCKLWAAAACRVSLPAPPCLPTSSLFLGAFAEPRRAHP